jgi:hypothetical protein
MVGREPLSEAFAEKTNPALLFRDPAPYKARLQYSHRRTEHGEAACHISPKSWMTAHPKVILRFCPEVCSWKLIS